ncbi:MAG: hypothetical protein J6U84_07785 [Bacteroidales bacterium]|jgi:hypothetical protein|nr:hypothetical protein [Bacteroidales bacterium]
MKKHIFILLTLFCFCITLFAVPAERKLITITQSNGKQLSYWLKGDEFIRWAESIDGYSLLRNQGGDWCYATLNEKGEMVASDIIACNPEERNVEEVIFLEKTDKKLFFSEEQLQIIRERRLNH